LLDLQVSEQKSDEETCTKVLSEPNYFLPKIQIKNEVEPDMSKEPFYCYPLEDNYTGIEPMPSSSGTFFKTMANVRNIDNTLDKNTIIEEIKTKIPYLYANRHEQQIQELKEFTTRHKSRGGKSINKHKINNGKKTTRKNKKKKKNKRSRKYLQQKL